MTAPSTHSEKDNVHLYAAVEKLKEDLQRQIRQELRHSEFPPGDTRRQPTKPRQQHAPRTGIETPR